MYSTYLTDIKADRVKALEVIEDLRYGRGFKHQDSRYVETSKIKALSYEERRRLYESDNHMDTIISEIVNLTPSLKSLKFATKSKEKINLINKSLDVINWYDLDYDITDTQVFKADVFLEVYFVEEDNIPRLRKLDSKKMIDIARDNYGRVIAYIYQDKVVNENVSYYGFDARVDRQTERLVTWVFEKGKTTLLDPYNTQKDDSGEIMLNEDGTPKIAPVVVSHRDVFYDEFYLIHIPSIKQTDNAFSDIIASKWIDHILRSDAIASDYRFINRMQAMGSNIVIDGALGDGSSRSPGGFIFIESVGEDNKASYIRSEIDNDLRTLTEEKLDCAITLARKAFLIRPDMEKALGSSDSSKVIQQLRLAMEKFLTKLLTHKINGMKKYFKMVQKCDPKIKVIDDFEFTLPSPVIESSVFDQLLQDMQGLNMGKITLRDIWKREGLTEEEMNEREARINEEIMNGKNDITISKSVASVGVNKNNTPDKAVDNNFKTEKAVGRKSKTV